MEWNENHYNETPVEELRVAGFQDQFDALRLEMSEAEEVGVLSARQLCDKFSSAVQRIYRTHPFTIEKFE